MRSFKAIFKKQLKDTIKNPAILIQFIIFPIIAFVINHLVTNMYGVTEEALANMPNQVTMQAGIFAGMGLIMVPMGIIAEDMDKKSLRFLTMAGVKPMSYLLGISGVILVAALCSSLAFTVIGGFTGMDFWIFLAAMMSGVVASIVLGSTFGLLAGNQQAASALSFPAAVIIGFGPMIAQFSDDVARVMHVVYTQHFNVIADYLNFGVSDAPLWHSFAIMWGNVAVLLVLFALVFRRKGIVG
ncbi:MAG: ABC transporter permease [Defluviitaleaceae bacterium]|nr:ABC transporter permease [Defluviitaleaceae bacterium]